VSAASNHEAPRLPGPHPSRRRFAALQDEGIDSSCLVKAGRLTAGKKSPALRRDLPFAHVSELASFLASLAGILLLLARLVAAALLLLAGLLSRVLLARILGLLTRLLMARLLIGIVHSGSPLLNAMQGITVRAGNRLLGNRVPWRF
jgi:hypothetical protein